MCKKNIKFKGKRRGQTKSSSTWIRGFESLRCSLCVVRKLNIFPESIFSVICTVWIVAWLMNEVTIKMPHSIMW